MSAALERARELALKYALPGRYDGISTLATDKGHADDKPYMKALREALNTPVTVPETSARKACRDHAMDDRETDATIAILRDLHLIGDGSGWARRVTEREWNERFGLELCSTRYPRDDALATARHFGFLTPPDPLGAVKAAHPDIDPAVVESIAKMVGEKGNG
jgi:hypothetical protein